MQSTGSQSERLDTQTSQRGSTPRRAAAARRGWFRRLFSDILFVSKRDRKWLLLPLIMLLLIMAALLFIATLAGPIAPFIYPIL